MFDFSTQFLFASTDQIFIYCPYLCLPFKGSSENEAHQQVFSMFTCLTLFPDVFHLQEVREKVGIIVALTHADNVSQILQKILDMWIWG